jgi:hypothetical protein
MPKYVYFGHDECTFQCTNMYTSDVKGQDGEWKLDTVIVIILVNHIL